MVTFGIPFFQRTCSSRQSKLYAPWPSSGGRGPGQGLQPQSARIGSSANRIPGSLLLDYMKMPPEADRTVGLDEEAAEGGQATQAPHRPTADPPPSSRNSSPWLQPGSTPANNSPASPNIAACYDRVLLALERRSRAKTRRHTFTYTGLLTCGTCRTPPNPRVELPGHGRKSHRDSTFALRPPRPRREKQGWVELNGIEP